ncbi:alanine acetyltransferase [Veronia nyctiphanis]|uniref:Alanine acetyltransferase n=1 Tax=Veronia nyctiphanis TaxID=1278244 RepID=A0A4Q0YUK5_9GAMM|nr:GNAT family N-acetyltransferase [Veronia nyctiphanis]RXJ74473.1 alanine acetyltransferase [Veronia nyctiphanis]
MKENNGIRVRQLTEADHTELFANYKSCVESARFVSSQVHTTQSATLVSIKRWRANYFSDDPKVLTFGVEWKESGEIIGLMILVFATSFAEIHYGVGKGFSGRGLATSICREGLVLLRDMGVKEVRTHPYHRHYASIRVLEKCGFTQHGILENYAVFPQLGEGKFDCADMRLSL